MLVLWNARFLLVEGSILYNQITVIGLEKEQNTNDSQNQKWKCRTVIQNKKLQPEIAVYWEKRKAIS